MKERLCSYMNSRLNAGDFGVNAEVPFFLINSQSKAMIDIVSFEIPNKKVVTIKYEKR